MATTTWTGAIDSDYDDAGNWSGVAPGPTDDAIIADVETQPICNIGVCSSISLTINSGASIDINGKSLQTDVFVNNGIIFSGTGLGHLNVDEGTIDAGGLGADKAIPNIIIAGFFTAVSLVNSDCKVVDKFWIQLMPTFDLNDQNLHTSTLVIDGEAHITKGTGAITFTGGGTINDGNTTKEDLGDIVIDGATSLVTDIQIVALTVNASKDLDTDGQELRVSGHATISGTITNATGTIKFNGTAQNITSNGNDLNDIEVASGCTLTLQDNLHVNDILNEGTVDYNGHTLTVDGEQTGGGSYIGEQGGSGGSGMRKRAAFALLAESEELDI